MLASTIPLARRAPFRAAGALMPVAVALVLLAAACSRDNSSSPPPANPTPTPGSVLGTTVGTALSPDQVLAEAKTEAVGFFEAQAALDDAKALDRSSGAAARTIRWAQAVNTLGAANGTPYQVKAVTAPNVRVQFDGVDQQPDGRWAARGFVELGHRPGPVAATSSTTSAPGSTRPAATSTFVVDLVFTPAGEHLKLDDYRLDDTPYPMSQLFTEIGSEDASNGLTGNLTLGHRDLDGSVQYFAEVRADGAAASPDRVAFESGAAGSAPPPGTDGTLLTDPAPSAGAAARVLAVFPGAFPGSAGFLRVVVGPGTTTGSSSAPATGTTIPTTTLRLKVPDWPALTPRPTNTLPPSEAPPGTGATSSSNSSTPTSTPTTVAGGPSTVTVTAPVSTTSTVTTTTITPTSTSSTAAR